MINPSNLISLEEFINLTGINEDEIAKEALIEHDQKTYLKPKKALEIFLQKLENTLMATDINGAILKPLFLEQSIKSIVLLYEKIIETTHHNTQDMNDENTLLKDTNISLQEQCEIYQSQIKALQNALIQKEEEIEFLKRKHKLMWGKVSNSSIGAK